MDLLDLSQITLGRQGDLRSEAMSTQPAPLNKRHIPLSHAAFYEAIATGLEQVAPVVGVAHALMGEGSVYMGIAQLESTNATIAPVVAWRVTHARRFAATLSMGLGVRGWNTVVFNQEMSLGMPTEGWGPRISAMIDGNAAMIRQMFKEDALTLRQLKAAVLTDPEAMFEITELVRAQAIPVTRVGYIIKDWYAPPIKPPEGEAYDTAWFLFNVCARYHLPGVNRPLAGAATTPIQVIERSRNQLQYFLKRFGAAPDSLKI